MDAAENKDFTGFPTKQAGVQHKMHSVRMFSTDSTWFMLG